MNAATYERDEVYGVLSFLGAVLDDVVSPEVDYPKTLPELEANILQNECGGVDTGVIRPLGPLFVPRRALSITLLYGEFASGMLMSTMTLCSLEIISGGNRRSGDLPSWVINLRDRERIHKTEEWPTRTRRAVRSETELYVPESSASPGNSQSWAAN
ncbi:hypothetical protein DL770_005418 [Monosporascus sp. CRB-9-2]|nr:hypothetical protein DL770_005418 [Monosporascus sp. CRB-9-2]